ncbi:MAG: hypothetical protein JOZ54_22790 [Acidobacteria bacterium]|nr:hypothetical protein [Acidobacteriota bacterium]
MSDVDLLRRVRDRAALAELYDRHAPALYAVASHIAGDAASEALEELFLALWDGSVRYDPHFGTPRCWLMRQIRTVALTRQAQNASASVDGLEAPTPRSLAFEAFCCGKGVAELARAHSLTKDEVRGMLCRGMSELRSEFAR